MKKLQLYLFMYQIEKKIAHKKRKCFTLKQI